MNQIQKFFEIIKEYDDFEYLLSIIMSSAAPTIEKHKTASLINFSNSNRKSKDIWNQYKQILCEKLNTSFYEARNEENSITVLIYNEDLLEKNLKNKNNIKFLKRFGYEEDMSVSECLEILKNRFKNVCPHEIGIFLGYPLDDVTTFIECPNEKCKFIGYWKVYHDVEKAKDIFNKYDKLKFDFIETVINGFKPTEIVENKLIG